MQRDIPALNIFQNPLIGRRRASDVVLFAQSVNRNDNIQSLYVWPCRRQRPERACEQVHVHALSQNQGDQRLDLPKSNERISAHDRQVERPVPIEIAWAARDYWALQLLRTAPNG